MNIFPPTEGDIEDKEATEDTNDRTEYKKIYFTQEKADKINITKKRIACQQWSFSLDQCSHTIQLQLVHYLREPTSWSSSSFSFEETLTKTTAQEIRKKIQGYKQQDKHKQMFDAEQFITYAYLLDKMIECQLLCRYCNQPIYLLYDISRENTQWTVDRIDNHVGHNRTNVCLSCLECNLKKRRRSDEKFYFAQRMVLIKCPDSG
jgi:hypothetical protein